ncbi:MAG: DUF4190 domain-containing protein [Actinomycetota bacterium]
MSEHNPPTGLPESNPVDLDATWGRPRTDLAPGGSPDPQVPSGPGVEQPPMVTDPPVAPGTLAYESAYPRSSLAMPALVLSIAGLLCCGVTAPFGFALGALDMRAIDRGLTDPSKRGTARAAVILGAVASVLLVIVLGVSLGLGAMSTMRGGG